MIKVWEEADNGLNSMTQKNIDGETPQQLMGETRNKWRQQEQERLSRVSQPSKRWTKSDIEATHRL